jgi:hypothetical protein
MGMLSVVLRKECRAGFTWLRTDFGDTVVYAELFGKSNAGLSRNSAVIG